MSKAEVTGLGWKMWGTFLNVLCYLRHSHIIGWEETHFVVVVVHLLSQVWLFVTPWIVACPAPLSFTISWSLSDSCQLSRWCYLSISSSASPFSFRLQSFPASGSFPVSCLFTSDGQSTGASVSASVLPINIQDLFPLRLTSLMSLLSKGLSRVFSSITVQKQTEIECFWQPHGMVDHIGLFWIERGKGDIYCTLM